MSGAAERDGSVERVWNEDQGAFFYHNHETGESVWSPPPGTKWASANEAVSAAAAGDSAPGRLPRFEQHHLEDGTPYYFDREQQESMWTTPRLPEAGATQEGARPQIKLVNGDLVQELPGVAPFLTHLRLSSNELGSVPAQIGACKALQVLDVSQNRLTKLPSELSSLKQLHAVLASENRFNSFPTALCSLHGLTLIDLSRNRITLVPKRVGGIRALQTLRLAHNDLQSVPAELGKCERLHWLDLSCNRLAALPNELSRLLRTTVLLLRGNRLREVPPCVARMRRLRTLDLARNELSSLPSTLGKALPAVTSLDLSHNRLGALPDSLAKMRRLSRLAAAGSRVARLPRSWTVHAALREAALRRQAQGGGVAERGEASPEETGGDADTQAGEPPAPLMPELASLDLGRNCLEHLPPGPAWLHIAPALRNLDLAGNALRVHPLLWAREGKAEAGGGGEGGSDRVRYPWLPSLQRLSLSQNPLSEGAEGGAGADDGREDGGEDGDSVLAAEESALSEAVVHALGTAAGRRRAVAALVAGHGPPYVAEPAAEKEEEGEQQQQQGGAPPAPAPFAHHHAVATAWQLSLARAVTRRLPLGQAASLAQSLVEARRYALAEIVLTPTIQRYGRDALRAMAEDSATSRARALAPAARTHRLAAWWEAAVRAAAALARQPGSGASEGKEEREAGPDVWAEAAAAVERGEGEAEEATRGSMLVHNLHELQGAAAAARQFSLVPATAADIVLPGGGDELTDEEIGALGADAHGLEQAEHAALGSWADEEGEGGSGLTQVTSGKVAADRAFQKALAASYGDAYRLVEAQEALGEAAAAAQRRAKAAVKQMRSGKRRAAQSGRAAIRRRSSALFAVRQQQGEGAGSALLRASTLGDGGGDRGATAAATPDSAEAVEVEEEAADHAPLDPMDEPLGAAREVDPVEGDALARAALRESVQLTSHTSLTAAAHRALAQRLGQLHLWRGLARRFVGRAGRALADLSTALAYAVPTEAEDGGGRPPQAGGGSILASDVRRGNRNALTVAAYVARARAWWDLGQPRNAIRDAAKALSRDPGRRAMWLLSAAAKVAGGLLEEASEDLERGEQCAGEVGGFCPHLIRGTILQGFGRYQEAVEELDRCLSVGPCRDSATVSCKAYLHRAQCRQATLQDEHDVLRDLSQAVTAGVLWLREVAGQEVTAPTDKSQRRALGAKGRAGAGGEDGLSVQHRVTVQDVNQSELRASLREVSALCRAALAARSTVYQSLPTLSAGDRARMAGSDFSLMQRLDKIGQST